jgi:DNA-binding transcriptional LysR family regulator
MPWRAPSAVARANRCCVAPALLELAQRYPRLELEVSFTDRTVDLVEEGFDLVVRNLATPEGAGLMSRRLASQRMTVCAAPAYLQTRGRPMTIDDLAAHDAVLYARDGRITPWAFPDGRGGTREAAIRSRVRFDDLEAVADAAVAGIGLAWLSCWLVAGRVRAGTLERVLEDVPGIVFETYALWPQASYLPSRVRAVIDALAARLPAMTG